MSDFEKLKELRGRVGEHARGSWPRLLEQLGIPSDYLRLRKAGPCPICRDGKDRYVFNDKHQRGDWHCRVCLGDGPYRDGLALLMGVHGWTFPQAADEVLRCLGLIQDGVVTQRADVPFAAPAARRPDLTPDVVANRIASYARVLRESQPVADGDPVDLYLRRRFPTLTDVPKILRLHPEHPYHVFDDQAKRQVIVGRYPCMLAPVTDPKGMIVNVHRTFLTHDGQKASPVDPNTGEVLPSRKKMPAIGENCEQIRLFPGTPSLLGIAEGIETAIGAWLFSGVPTWPVISTAGMGNFVVPDWVRQLIVFQDHDGWKTRRAGSERYKPGFDAGRKLLERQDVQKRIQEGTLRVLMRAPAVEGQDMASLAGS